MEMKDRVENLLKIAREIDSDNDARSWGIGKLRDGLQELIQDTELRKHLAVEWEKMLYEKRLARWDEEFLKITSGEESVTTIKPSSGFGQAPIKGQGQQVTYPTVTATGTTLNLANNATAATWATPTTTEKDLEMVKDEILKLKKAHEAKMQYDLEKKLDKLAKGVRK
jgi:hypothetical protein